jgi:hypothetical protein
MLIGYKLVITLLVFSIVSFIVSTIFMRSVSPVGFLNNALFTARERKIVFWRGLSIIAIILFAVILLLLLLVSMWMA